MARSRLTARSWDLLLAVVRDSPLAAWARDWPPETVDSTMGWAFQEERFAPVRISSRKKRLQLECITRHRSRSAVSAKQTPCTHFNAQLRTLIDPGGNEYVAAGSLVWVTGGPSGSAKPFGPLGCHTYCAFPNIVRVTGPRNEIALRAS